MSVLDLVRMKLAVVVASVLVGSVLAANVDYSCVHSTAWVLNSDHTNSYFDDTVTDVQSSSLSSGQWSITTNRIPNYDHKFTTEEITTLNSRPKASSDFTTGATTISAGEKVIYGEDIGYVGLLHGQGCDMGYWPPGPGCPTASTGTHTFALTPAPETRSAGHLPGFILLS